MKEDLLLREAGRLHGCGFAILWLHPKSKRPIGNKWTTGPKSSWSSLYETYQPGMNVGVRLGEPSFIDDGYLAVLDVDVRSSDPRHQSEAMGAARRALGPADGACAYVESGRGGGSGHFYFRTKEPFKTWNPAASLDLVKVHMPSKRASKAEITQLTAAEIKGGIRLARAWEISLYSSGRQVVLPPSIHPDSGKAYRWVNFLESILDLPLLPIGEDPNQSEKKPAKSAAEGVPDSINKLFVFHPKPVELDWLPISREVRDGIQLGVGVTDRSGYLLRAAQALYSAGCDRDEVLTVLTDPETFLGECAYEHAQTKNRVVAARWVDRYTLTKIGADREEGRIFEKVKGLSAPRTLSSEERAAQDLLFASDWNWRQELVLGGQNGNGPPKNLVQNVVLVLAHEVGEDVIRRNEFAYRDTYTGNTPWGGKPGAVVTDDDVARIKYWLGVNYHFEPKDNTIEDALVELACRNAYDPVKDALDNLPAWDGVNRLDTWLIDHFEAEGDPEYLAQVFRKWMVAMVVRVFEPGAKFDWMPIFEGAQGIGKSSFGRVLVGDQYFLDWLPNLNDKDSALSLQGMWGVEMGELSQFRKNELENIKAFITRTVDKLRPPYGRRLIESPRRCVFFGTTNRKTYLIDETGNRRFKPIVVGRLDFKILKRDRIQLFSEAKYLYDQKIESKRTLELTGQALVFEKEIHHEKMVEDDSHAMQELMVDFVEKVEAKRVEFDLSRFCIRELFEGTGPLTKWKYDNRNSQFTAKMLRRLGFVMRHSNKTKWWFSPSNDKSDGFEGSTRHH